MELEKRFWKKTKKENGHTLWTGRKDKWGYGYFDMDVEGRNRPVMAHRVAWWLERGEWPPETLDHLCLNHSCVNTKHLEPVSQSVNTKRALAVNGHPNSNKTHCAKGHEYTPENTRYGTRGDGRKFRICKTCDLLQTHTRRGPEKTQHSGPRRQT